MKRYILTVGVLFVFVFGSITFSFSQVANQKLTCVGFYNLENLFDTKDDPNKRDEDFTPKGRYAWGQLKYANKLTNLAAVISDIATDISSEGLAVLGVCEIENRKVLEDLVLQEKLKKRQYKIIHFESPDRRGIDVGLLYQEKHFQPTHSVSHKLTFANDSSYLTRNQLVVSGEMDGDKLSFIVAHWPSRLGGQVKSEPRRLEAALLGRKIIDSLLGVDPMAKIILMGDLNDDPINKSVKDYLQGRRKIAKMKKGDMYNTLFCKFKKGEGTSAYRGEWNLFDQILISEGLVEADLFSYNFDRAYIYNKAYLKQKDGDYKGYPKRTHAGGLYLNGYSDHFPVFLVLKKTLK